MLLRKEFSRIASEIFARSAKTQAAFAADCGIHKNTLRLALAGGNITIDTMERILLAGQRATRTGYHEDFAKTIEMAAQEAYED